MKIKKRNEGRMKDDAREKGRKIVKIERPRKSEGDKNKKRE